MSIGKSGGDYTSLRNEAIKQADELGSQNKHVRLKEGGKTLYFHDSDKNEISSLNPFRTGQRNKKRKLGAEAIKESINKQFRHFCDEHGNQLNVGDLVFRNIDANRGRFESKIRQGVKARDFATIDREIAKVLDARVGTADPAKHNEARLVAKGLRLTAVNGMKTALMPNMPAIRQQAQQFRDALTADLILAGQADWEAARNSKNIVEEMQAGGDRLNVDLGLTHEQIDAVSQRFQQHGIKPVFMNEMRQLLNLRLKDRHVGTQMTAAATNLRNVVDGLQHNNDSSVANVRKFADLTDRLLNQMPNLDQQTCLKHLARHVAMGRQLHAQLQDKGGWASQLADPIEKLTCAANERMVATLPMAQRYNLNLRPNSTSSEMLNRQSSLYEAADVKMGNGHMEASPRLLHSVAHGNDKSIFIRQRNRYNAEIKLVNTALQAFKADPNDQNLGQLMTHVNRAQLASDKYLRALRIAGHRAGRLKSRGTNTRLNLARKAVMEQRVKLQKLGLQTGAINDQRNRIGNGSQLPGAHLNEQTHGMKRNIDNRWQQFLNNPFQFGQAIHQAGVAVQFVPQPALPANPMPPPAVPDIAFAKLPPQIEELEPNFIGATVGGDDAMSVSDDESELSDRLDNLSLLVIADDQEPAPLEPQNTEGEPVENNDLKDLVINEDFDVEKELANLKLQPEGQQILRPPLANAPKSVQIDGIDPDDIIHDEEVIGSDVDELTPKGPNNVDDDEDFEIDDDDDSDSQSQVSDEANEKLRRNDDDDNADGGGIGIGDNLGNAQNVQEVDAVDGINDDANDDDDGYFPDNLQQRLLGIAQGLSQYAANEARETIEALEENENPAMAMAGLMGLNEFNSDLNEEELAEVKELMDAIISAKHEMDNPPEIEPEPELVPLTDQQSIEAIGMSTDDFKETLLTKLKEVDSDYHPKNAEALAAVKDKMVLELDKQGRVRFQIKDLGDIEDVWARFDPNTGLMELGLAEIHPRAQGKGILQRFFEGMLDIASKPNSKLKKMEMQANIDVGGYAWARYGFVPIKADYHQIVNGAKTKIRNYIDGPLKNKKLNKDSTKKQLESLIREIDAAQDQPKPRLIRKIAALNMSVKIDEEFFEETYLGHNEHKQGGSESLGKACLCGTSWNGTFDMTENSADRRLLENYIGMRKFNLLAKKRYLGQVAKGE